MTWPERVDAALDGIRAEGRWREVRDFVAADDHRGTLPDGRRVVSFASNDYLGLTHHPAVIAAARDAVDRWGTGSGASRLVVGSRPIHGELEAELAGWKGTEAALVFPTGFAANLGVLATLGGADVTVISDELNHASIIDGCRLSRASVRVYRHADVEHAAKLLADTSGPAIVVTDAVFSMDGDAAPLDDLLALCADRDALLVVDEAHAVLGPDLPADHAATVVRVGTLSKALGALGGFVAAERRIVELLVNRARPFIFTTAPTPADTAAALAALRIVRSADGDALRARLRAHVDRLVPGHASPIVPIILGEEEAALRAAAQLLEQGWLVPAIRPPTVAPGTSRLRVALSAGHREDEVAGLAAALAALGDAA